MLAVEGHTAFVGTAILALAGTAAGLLARNQAQFPLMATRLGATGLGVVQVRLEHERIAVDLLLLVTAHAAELRHLARIGRVDAAVDVAQQGMLGGLAAVTADAQAILADLGAGIVAIRTDADFDDQRIRVEITVGNVIGGHPIVMGIEIPMTVGTATGKGLFVGIGSR